jgi:signal transduction histidine kinase/CheY-like chemotaxis protein
MKTETSINAPRSFDIRKLLEPGVRLMRNLPFSTKAGVITLVFLIPILLLGSAAVVDYLDRSEFTQHELHGMQLLQSFAPLNQQLVLARNTTRARLGGFDALADYTASRARADALFTQIDRELSHSGDPHDLRSALTALRHKWEDTASTAMQTEGEAKQTVFVPVTEASIEFVQQISDRSGIILDPEIDTLYLGLAAVQIYPVLLENLGQLRSWSTYLMAKSDSLTFADINRARHRYAVWDANVRANLALYRTYVEKARQHNPALQARLDLGLLERVESYRNMAFGVVMQGAELPPITLWTAGGVVFEELRHANQTLLPVLSELLQKRLYELRVKHALLGLGTLLALMLAVYCFFSFYRGMVHDMAQQELDDAALRLAKRQAEQASVAKSQFLANMSHELRTPMNGILGMLQLLQNTALNSRQLDYAQKSEGAAQSLLALLNEILDFSKIEADKMTLDAQPFRSEQLLSHLSMILSANERAQAVALVFDIDPALPAALVGDDQRLQQILINLGGNALKFTERGQVVLGIKVLARLGDQVHLAFSVTDTGIGIAPENQKRIFTGFLQAESSTTRRFGGTGLGLAICERLVALMGGSLQLESTLGEGSRFYFTLTLPVADLPEVAATQAPVAREAVLDSNANRSLAEVVSVPVTKPQRLLGLRILLVEDNLINQQVAKELLGREGALIVIAGNGRAGVDAVRDTVPPFDVVLMDLQMPVMDGFEATSEIRQTLSQTLPIIAMTANAMSSDREACLASGMNDHIGKPFNLTHLVSVLLRLTGRSVA